MGSFVYQESKHGIMDDYDHSNSSDVSSGVCNSEDNSDLFEEVNSFDSSSSSASSPTSVVANSSSSGMASKGSFHDMSSLLQELPFKRGLSKHYNGKSQSFTSLSNVRCLEDLAKPENHYNKKLKSCKSYGVFYEEDHGGSNHQTTASRTNNLCSSKQISSQRKDSRGSCSSLCGKRNNSFIGNTNNRPPIPLPLKSASRSSFTAQPPLFALGV